MLEHDSVSPEPATASCGAVAAVDHRSGLVPVGKALLREIRRRREVMPAIDEVRWAILLELYLAMDDSRGTPFMSAAHASSAPVSSAQRYIHAMIKTGLIVPDRSGPDQRVTRIALTPAGVALVERGIATIAEQRTRG